MSKILYNAIRTPDGTLLESKFRHDYVTHTDLNGLRYMVDGGHAYLRRALMPAAPYEELSLTEDSYIGDIRKVWTWGTYGKNGDEKYSRVKLKDMTEDHIKAICSQEQYSRWHALLKRELAHRADRARATS